MATKNHWSTELTARAHRSFAVTVIGTTLLSGLFFVGYFCIQLHPRHPPSVIPLTSLDLWVPFNPEFLIPYLSLWLYLGSGPGLQLDGRARAAYARWMIALALTGLFIFWAWPSRALTLPVPGDFPGINALQQVDQTSNACPSMHVAAAIFTAVRVNQVLRTTGSPWYMRSFNWLWFAAIAYSTLAIRQHVILDVVAGALFGLAFAAASLASSRYFG